MIRRAFLIIFSLLALSVALLAALLASGNLAKALNPWLPTGWQLMMPESVRRTASGLILPQFSLRYQGCPLLESENLEWRSENRLPLANLTLEKLTLDYRCLSELANAPRSNAENPPDFPAWLTLLPNSQLHIHALHWRNLPPHSPSFSAHIAALFATPATLSFAKNGEKLTAFLNQQAVNFSAEWHLAQGENALSGELDYRPTAQTHHHFRLRTNSLKFDRLPADFHLHYRWQLPDGALSDPTLQQGESVLQWQGEQGSWWLKSHHLSAPPLPEKQFHLPFRLAGGSLQIEQGTFDWALSENFALRGFLSSQITPNSLKLDALFPLKTALRISLLSENAKGKGNIVISSQNGEWQADRLTLPLQITGNVKQGNFILYSAVPLEIDGQYQDLTLRFLPSALLRLTGTERFLTLHDLRFPLAGLKIDKHGLTGRLHAIFRGESPDFKAIELHLDGFARQFKMGALDFFRSPTDANGNVETAADRWQWRLWGRSQLKAFNAPLALAGRGHWHGNLVELSEFNGDLGAIRQNGVRIPKMALRLTEPLRFAYAQFLLHGGVKLTAPTLAFDYGGELTDLSAQLNVAGEVENLRLKGEVRAGDLGPIKLFARRQLSAKASSLIGRLYWPAQPAKVFQPLLPFRSQWVITQGEIRGETAFSATADRGLIAGGHFAIQNGAVSLPTGELKGIRFSLPYHYQQNQVQLGAKQPLEVNIDEVQLGVPMRNLRVKVQGHYPYSAKRPLFLRELSLSLLGGQWQVERLALPQRQAAELVVSNLDLAELLNLAQYQQLDLHGKVNGRLPFWLSGKPCYICAGTLTQAGRSRLKLGEPLWQAMKQSGYTEQILSYLVHDSHLDQFNATLDLDTQGTMQLQTAMKLSLASHQNARINLNYRHQENLFDLWRLINYGANLEQQIEHSIYQQLDQR